MFNANQRPFILIGQSYLTCKEYGIFDLFVFLHILTIALSIRLLLSVIDDPFLYSNPSLR
jgi:hypothetical protein